MGEAQLNYILRFKDPRNMKKALENSVPNQLFDLYETVMAAIRCSSDDSNELSQRVLSWIYHARRPLKMSELREAAAIKIGDVSLDEEDLMKGNDIIELCGSLITYDSVSQVVRFSHEMVQEFLKSRYVEYLLRQSDIAKLCLTFLLLEAFEDGRCQDQASYGRRLEKHPFGQYCAQYWVEHIIKEECDGDREIRDLLLKLLPSNRAEAICQMQLASRAEDWDEESDKGVTLFHVLANQELAALTRELFEEEAKRSAQQKESQAQSGITAMINAKTERGWTPLHVAAGSGDMDMIELLLQNDAEVDAETALGTALHVAAIRNRPAVVRRLLLANATVSVKEEDGMTPLHLAAIEGHAEVVNLLVGSNAELEAKTTVGETPLHLAAEYGLIDAVKCLILAKADVKAVQNNGWTALHTAASKGHVKVVDVLLEYGSEPMARTTTGNTPLRLCRCGATSPRLSILSCLLQRTSTSR